MTRARLALTVALTAFAAGGAAAPADAQCWVWNVQGVSFGTYDVFSPAPVDSVGRLTILCLPAQWIQVSLSRGGGPSYQPRTMRSGPNQLGYNLFLDAARTVVWGDGTQGTQPFQGLHWWFSLPIYGRIPPAQDVAIGTYTDRIVATINF